MLPIVNETFKFNNILAIIAIEEYGYGHRDGIFQKENE